METFKNLFFILKIHNGFASHTFFFFLGYFNSNINSLGSQKIIQLWDKDKKKNKNFSPIWKYYYKNEILL